MTDKEKFADLPPGDAKERQRRRQQQLEAMARLAGWDSWSQFVTALKNGEVEFPRRNERK